MFKLNIRAVGILLTVGICIGCSTSDTIRKSNLSEQPLTVSELEATIPVLNDKIAEYPANGVYFYRKGFVLNELVLKKKRLPSKRTYFTKMQRSLAKAKKLYSRTDDSTGIRKVDELLQTVWCREHNEGVQILEQNPVLTENNYKSAAIRFHNATIIIPDSAVSYSMEAEMLYQTEQYKRAVNTLERAQKSIDKLPAKLWEQLAYLYWQNGQHHKAIDAYKEAKKSNNSIQILQGLVNVYISEEDHKKAVELLTVLIKKESDNLAYILSKGQQLYLIGSSFLTSYSDALQDNSISAQHYFRKAKLSFHKADKQFEIILKSNPSNTSTIRAIANMYYNIAADYQQILAAVSSQRRTYIEQQISSNLSTTILLYKQLAENSVQDETYLTQLYQIYRYLDMNKKAQNIKARMK